MTYKMPSTWTKIKISDLFEEICDKNHPNANVLTIIQGIGTVLREESGREIIYDKSSLASYKYVKKGDFIIHLRSFEGGLEVANQDGIVSPAYIILRPKIDVSIIYLYALFHSNQFINQTMAPAVEGVRDGRSVKYDVLKKQKVLLPPFSEQKKIAEILSGQAKIIELKEKLIAEKQKRKNWLVQAMTTGEKRLSPFKGKWTKIPLANVTDIVADSINPNDYQNEQFEVYSLPAFDNGKVPEILFGSEICTNKFLIHKGMVLFNKLNVRQRRVWLVSKNPLHRAISSTEFLPIVTKGIDNTFLAYLLFNDSVTNYLKNKSSGTSNSQKRILPKDLMTMKVKTPSLLEQQAIATVLLSADEEISLLQRNLEQEKLKKKVLAQLLLSGIVRVKNTKEIKNA